MASIACTSPPLKNQPNDQTLEETSDQTEDTPLVQEDADSGNTDSGNTDSEDADESPITWTDCTGIPGDKACDFTFQDQNGDEWSLYDNYGTVMVLDFSTMWCGVCNILAPGVQAHQDAYTDRGYDFLWVTILVDDATWGNPPDVSEALEWANVYGITTSPVLAGDRTVIDTTAADGYPITSWPTLVVVDETMTIHNGLLGWNEEIIFSWVDDIFGIVR